MANKKCPICGYDAVEKAMHCPKCYYSFTTGKVNSKKCQYCNSIISSDATKCPQCKKKQKNNRGIKIVLFILIMIGIISITQNKNTPSSSDKVDVSTDTIEANDNTDIIEKTPKEKFIEDFSKDSLYAEETCENLWNFLNVDLLFSDIKYLEKNSVGDTNFDINADGYILMVTVDAENIYRIICGDFILYENANICMTKQDLDNRNMSGYESLFYVVAKEIVENNLKSPSTAKFCSLNECSMERSDDIGIVVGYVEAQNSFGVMIRSNFTVEFKIIDASNYTYETIFIQIDDQQSGEFIDL